MKWECNACADTENRYLPCVFVNLICNDPPSICPMSNEESEWDLRFKVDAFPLGTSITAVKELQAQQRGLCCQKSLF